MYAEFDTVTGSCATGVVYNFKDYWERWGSNVNAQNAIPPGGCGWVLVNYVVALSKNRPLEPNLLENSQKVREILDQRWKIVFETEPRVNRNTGNTCVLVIYQLDEKDKYGFSDVEEADTDDDDDDDEVEF